MSPINQDPPLMLVLTLFILSRIFKRGAEMRAELEGTI